MKQQRVTRKQIDINCDLGEGCNAEDCARDARLMPFISRCNIACGGHAGNLITMALSIANALEHNLTIGAHPGYPDPVNFGRKSLSMEAPALLQSISQQIDQLIATASKQGARLDHIKLHGALYNDAESTPELAEALVTHIRSQFPSLKILGLANATMEKAARRLGQPFLREGFMDRRYLNDHQLSPRTMTGAVIEEFPVCLQQVLGLIHGEAFPSIQGEALTFSVDSICLHGDNPEAEQIARQLHKSLLQDGVIVAP